MFVATEFKHASIAKSSPMLTSRDFTSTILSKLSFLRYSSKSPLNTIRDELQISILDKDSSNRNLGPGSYEIRSGPLGPSYNFGYAPRFKLRYGPTMQFNKSADKIRQNKNIELHTPIKKSMILQQKFTKKRLTESINRQTKSILDSERKERVQAKIDEKIHKIEVRKNRTIRNAITQSYVVLMISLMVPRIMHGKFKRVCAHKNKVNKHLATFAMVCRAIGRFRFSHRAVRYKLSWIVLKRYMPELIRAKKVKVYSVFQDRLIDIIEGFIKSGSIPKINLLIRKKVILIQKYVRNYLAVNRARILATKKYWDRIDSASYKVPGHIRNYYICKYLRKRIQAFNLEKYKLHKFFVFLTSRESDHLFQDIFTEMQNYQLPIFRVYQKKFIKEFIKEAYIESEKWKDIEFHDLPQEFKPHRNTLVHFHPILKHTNHIHNKAKAKKVDSIKIKRKGLKTVRIKANPVILNNE